MIYFLFRRQAQLQKLRSVMVKTHKLYKEGANPGDAKTEVSMFGADDPDPNYVLTMDNAKKILAIHQRLRFAISHIIVVLLATYSLLEIVEET